MGTQRIPIVHEAETTICLLRNLESIALVEISRDKYRSRVAIIPRVKACHCASTAMMDLLHRVDCTALRQTGSAMVTIPSLATMLRISQLLSADCIVHVCLENFRYVSFRAPIPDFCESSIPTIRTQWLGKSRYLSSVGVSMAYSLVSG